MNTDDKKAFRKAMLTKRDAIPSEDRAEADKERNKQLRNWDVYKKAEWLLFYVSYRSEADTLQLLTEALTAGRNVAVPKVWGSDMVFYRISSLSQLKEGYKGILEPDTAKSTPITVMERMAEEQEAISGQTEPPIKRNLPENTILFVPGCAFDGNGGRMGYGGGFYDRFMEKYPEILRVALAYEEQLVPQVPCESHDKRVDAIVTENRIVYASTGTNKE